MHQPRGCSCCLAHPNSAQEHRAAVLSQPGCHSRLSMLPCHRVYHRRVLLVLPYIRSEASLRGQGRHEHHTRPQPYICVHTHAAGPYSPRKLREKPTNETRPCSNGWGHRALCIGLHTCLPAAAAQGFRCQCCLHSLQMKMLARCTAALRSRQPS